MIQRALLTLLTTLALGLSACEDSLPLDPESPREVLRARVAEGRATGFIDPHRTATAHHPASADLFRRLDDIDAWLDDEAPWDDGVPAWLDPGIRPTLGSRLSPLGPFYEEINALILFPPHQEALIRFEPVAHRSTIHGCTEPIDSYATPSLARSGRWIDLLCAKAVAEASSPIGSEGAVRYLTQALDLVRLLDDGSLLGAGVSVALETQILRALHLIGLGPRLDPVLLRRELEPRLAHIGAKVRLWSALRAEISLRVEATEEILRNPGRDGEDAWMAHLDTSRTRMAERALDVLYIQDELRNASTFCSRALQFGNNHPFQPIIDAAKAVHEFETYAYLARMAVVMNEYRFVEGDWPRYLSDMREGFSGPMPNVVCRGLRSHYDRGFQEVSLSCFSRLADEPEPNADPLLSWVWTPDLVQQFEDRR
jgi:hypothetical protein